MVDKSKRKLFLGVIFVVFVIATTVFSAIGASLWGVELHSIEQEIAKIEEENRQLSSEIISKTSLSSLYNKSEELGYSNPEVVIYVTKDTSVAQLPQ